MTNRSGNVPRIPPPTPFRESVWILPFSEPQEPLVLDSTGITLRDPDYRIVRPPGNCAHYFVLECILAGRGHLFCENRHLQPGPGDVYLLPPDLPNEYYTVASDPWEKIWFNISGEFVNALVECYRLTGLVYLPHAGLEREFREGMEIVRTARDDAYSALAARLTAIFSRMHRLRGDRRNRRSPEGIRLKEHLDDHWREPFSLTELSRVIGKSPTQTMRIFRADYGITPGAYFRQRRYRIALRYLENTRNSIRSIADLLGFANEFHFSAWFKKQNGASPKLHRDRIRRGDAPAE